MTSKYNKKLDRQRSQIRSTGQKDAGYMGTHGGYAPKHKKTGCGLAVLIIGLIMSTSAAITLSIIMENI